MLLRTLISFGYFQSQIYSILLNVQNIAFRKTNEPIQFIEIGSAIVKKGMIFAAFYPKGGVNHEMGSITMVSARQHVSRLVQPGHHWWFGRADDHLFIHQLLVQRPEVGETS